MPPESNMRVLLIAEAANPNTVSVPLVGWSHSRAIAKLCDAHVVTQVRNRKAFEERGLKEGRDFTAIDTEAIAAPTYRFATWLRGGTGKGWTINTAVKAMSYCFFERALWKQFRHRIESDEFDIVHRITPLSPTAPSLLARRLNKAGVPFVVGPLNGGLPWPRQFNSARHQEREWLSYLRSMHRLMPGYRATRRFASAIVAGSINTLEQIPDRYRDRCVYIPENGIDTARFAASASPPITDPLRAAFVGRLVPYKGPDILIEAVTPLAKRGDLRLDLYGDGPLSDMLQRLIDEHQVGHAIKLHGNVEHTQLQSALRESQMLLFPSFREFGGAVVLEAMALGVVPMVIDYGGPAELVTTQSGYLLPMADRQTMVTQIRSNVERVIENPSQLTSRSAAAMARVDRCFTWQAKARQTMQVYRWVLGQADRPDFGIPLTDDVHSVETANLESTDHASVFAE